MTPDIVGILNNYNSPLIVGPCPPPLGGVSVHVYRLSKLLNRPRVFDISSGGGGKYLRLLKVLLLNDVDVVHLHVLTMKVLSIVFFAKVLKGFDVITTDHNSRLFENRSYLDRFLLRFFLGRVTVKIVVGAQIKETYLKEKIASAADAMVSNSFIPPPIEDEANILTTYPREYKEFITMHYPVLTTNAYQLVMLDGIDLYGLDMCIDLLHKLKPLYPQSGLIIFLADDKKLSGYLLSLKKKITDYSLQEDVLFVTGQRELWPAYRDADLMLRPTYSDGFGVSVAEALYLGCPALASDVCGRAKGTSVFKNRNQDDFFLRTRQILSLKPRASTSSMNAETA